MDLPNSQELLERSIFHAIRITTVAAGYIPDVMLYDLANPDINIASQEQQRYNAAVKAIVEEKGFAIEIFNNSPGQDKGQLKVPRIYIETESFLPGQLGLDTSKTYLPQPDGNYIAENNFLTQTSDFYFHVRLLSNDVKQQRIMYGIMLKTLPRRGYMKWAHLPTLLPYQNLFVNYTSHSEFNWVDEGIVEKGYRYEIPDVQELDPELLGNIPAIKEIGTDNLDITIQ